MRKKRNRVQDITRTNPDQNRNRPGGSKPDFFSPALTARLYFFKGSEFGGTCWSDYPRMNCQPAVH
jgi:hypothetical protein